MNTYAAYVFEGDRRTVLMTVEAESEQEACQVIDRIMDSHLTEEGVDDDAAVFSVYTQAWRRGGVLVAPLKLVKHLNREQHEQEAVRHDYNRLMTEAENMREMLTRTLVERDRLQAKLDASSREAEKSKKDACKLARELADACAEIAQLESVIHAARMNLNVVDTMI